VKIFPYYLKRILILTFAGLHLANYFIESTVLFYICCSLQVYIFVSAIMELPKLNSRVSLGLMGIGVALMLWKKMPLEAWFLAVDKNGGIATLFIAVQMMFLPFFYDDYQEELKKVAKVYMRSLVPFGILTFLVSHIFGVIIGIGAVALVYELFKKNAELYDAENVFMSSLMRGYCTSGFWSPAWASILVVTTQMKVPWASIIPWGLVFTLLLCIVNTVSIWFKMKRNPDKYPILKAEDDLKVDWSQVYKLVALALALILSILTMSLITPWDLMIIIPIVSIIFPIIAAFIQSKWGKYREGMQRYFDKSTIKVQGEVVLFTAAGFLSKALEYSGVGAMIPRLIPDWMSQYPGLLIASIMLLMILPSLAGVHPVAIGTALATTVVPESIGLTKFSFALTIVAGWAFAIQFSPFSAVSLIAGGLVNRFPWEISLGLSGKYGVFCVILFSFILAGINAWI